MIQIINNPAAQTWPQLLQRPQLDNTSLQSTVENILKDVQRNGDKALQQYTLQFDKAVVDELVVTDMEILQAGEQISPALQSAIDVAIENITAFHKSQLVPEQVITTMPGVDCWRKSIAIQKVGLYIPGGTAPLFSTLIMLAVPAILAGCSQITICTPPDKNGAIHPAILYIAQKLQLKNVYKVGGVQAIAAMAYGTESVKKVHKIFGPGNQFVTCAKQLVSQQGIAIDMPAGPSELAIFADETCLPAFVAADILSQAEHGADSQIIVVTTNLQLANEIREEVESQIQLLPRQATAQQAINNSKIIVIPSSSTAFELLNEYAPEHLIIASDVATSLQQLVINAGSVFIGNYTPESAGDYASGTNHTLPTNGYAKAYSGVSVDSFFKKVTFQQITPTGLQLLGNTITTMANEEGLTAHANAVTIRTNNDLAKK